MSGYLPGITPDSLSGAVFAFEGIERAVTLINGPTGCKYFHSAISDAQSLRAYEFDPLGYPAQWYFGQPRVPSDYLDKRDYVYGSQSKLGDALRFLGTLKGKIDLIAVVNSPGASLIGDELDRIAGEADPGVRVITLESPGFSKTQFDGYAIAASSLISEFVPDGIGAKKPLSVNLCGVSVQQKYFSGDVREITRLLGLCGISVNACLCAKSGVEDLKRAGDASLNVVVWPDWACGVPEALFSRTGAEFYNPGFAPVGFDATEAFIQDIAALLGADASAFMEESGKARAAAYVNVSRVNSLTGLPKGEGIAISGSWGQVASYASFLCTYFGLSLEAVSIQDPEWDPCRLDCENLLGILGASEALAADPEDSQASLVFGDANLIARMKLSGKRFCGIETSLPSMGYLDVVEKTHLGLSGALLLTEQVLNGLLF